MKIKPHNFLFLFGTLYYLIIPPIVGILGLVSDMPGMNAWYSDFYYVKEKLDIYFLIVLSYVVSFYLGSSFIKMIPIKKKSLAPSYKYYSSSIKLFGYILLLIIMFISYQNISILFTGYETYDYLFLGALGTINIISLFFFIYTLLEGKNNKIFLIVLVFSSFILIGLGSRMYVLIPIISFFIYKLFYAKRKYNFTKLIFYGIPIAILLLLIGAIRIGADVNAEFLTYIFLAEPVFTWWSASTFLSANELLAIDIPISYISSFVNFLPSFFFPDKAKLLISITENHFFESPLGATSMFVSIQGNFGWYGGMIFMSVFRLFYSIVELYTKRNNFILTYYICIVSVLPFQFFRDGFSIINKQLFWNMLIVPLLLMAIGLFIHKIFIKVQDKK